MSLLTYCMFFIKTVGAIPLSTHYSANASYPFIHNQPPFFSQISAIPSALQQQMQMYTWHPGCPVNLSDLAYVQLSYWGFDNKSHQGILIVNAKVAENVVDIFKQLYVIKFPIAKMQPLDVYYGNDLQSMADNNTVAFNCRAMTSDATRFSLHSYGKAIDINPLFNPYIEGNTIYPPEGKFYLARNPNIIGTITHGSPIYAVFIAHGWKWGGDWQGLKDYQHFEKE